MKILHTSDLHLGKRLEGILRLSEQKECLGEIVKIAEEERVDAVLVAGDVFDTKYPVPEAEELFYEFCRNLSEKKILLVAISGNHDESIRLSAARSLAKSLGCFFIGSNDLTDLSFNLTKVEVVGGECGLKIIKGEETLNILTLPFFTRSFLSFLGLEKESYEENLTELIGRGKWVFENSDKALNIFMGHIFITGSILTGDESELGTLVEVSKEILPSCHYSALGHIHKKTTVSKQKNAYYSGSILQYKFDESPLKGCNIVEKISNLGNKGDEEKKSDLGSKGDEETKNGLVSIKFVPFTAGKKLVSVSANNMEEALAALEQNANSFVELKYYGAPLVASEIKELKKNACLMKITNCYLEEKTPNLKMRETFSDSQLFEAFYEEKCGKKPSAEEIDLFLKVLKNEEIIEI